MSLKNKMFSAIALMTATSLAFANTPFTTYQLTEFNTVDAFAQTGADMCAKISAAATVLQSSSPGGGTIEARGFTGIQTCAASMFAGWPADTGTGFYSTVLLGNVNIRMPVSTIVPSRTAIQGTIPYNIASGGDHAGASIQVTAGFPNNTPVVDFGSANPAFSIRVSNLEISCQPPSGSNPTGSIGLRNTYSQEQTEVSQIDIRGCHTGMQLTGYAADGQSYRHITIDDTGLTNSVTDFVCLDVGNSSNPSGSQQQMIAEIGIISCGASTARSTVAIYLDSFNYALRHVYIEMQGSGQAGTDEVAIGTRGLTTTGNIVVEDIYGGGYTNGFHIGSAVIKPVTLSTSQVGTTNLVKDDTTGGVTIPISSETSLGLYARGYGTSACYVTNSRYALTNGGSPFHC